MKKLYTLLLCAGSSAFAQQQIPNGGFESWETISYETASYEAPSPWDPGSACASSNIDAVCSVSGTKTTDAASGEYAMKLSSQEGFSMAILANYPVTGNQRPVSAEFMAKSEFTEGADFLVTIFFHNGDLMGDPEALGLFRIPVTESSSEYVKYTDEILFSSAKSYEFMSIVLSFEDTDSTEASFFTIDDFKLVYDLEVGLSSDKGTNQAISATVVNSVLVFEKQISSYQILGQRGEQLLNGASQEVNLSVLHAGLYFVKAITADAEVFTYRIFKQ